MRRFQLLLIVAHWKSFAETDADRCGKFFNFLDEGTG